ncbi:MAG: PP2C family serine/threonine-protein phosphatase [Methanoregula sp.]|jgi:hypothetical protein
MTWKHIASSVTGKSHIDRHENGQDCCRTGVVQLADKEFFIGLTADGAGSTVWGGTGAHIACESTYMNILDTLRRTMDVSHITDADIRAWICAAHNAIVAQAKIRGIPVKEFACTLIGAVTGDNHAVYFQIGDGGMVVRSTGEYETIFWPEQGEYANTTYFITDAAFLDHVRILCTGSSPEEIALFTDGLQNLVLSFSAKKAHAGFFKPLFDAIRNNRDNTLMDLSSHLEHFLNRNEINDRSDDDKTLILAVRFPG